MRHYFPLLEQCLYFNTAYTAPLSTDLRQWRLEDDDHFFTGGDHYKLKQEKNYIKEAKIALASFVGALPKNTFISSNFSSALQNFLIQLPRYYRFLSLKEEYPSLTGIIQDLGFETTLIPLTATIEEDIWQALQQNEYQVLALSAIQYSNGFLVDFAILEKIKKAFPELIILVDGTQFIGAEEFSLSNSCVDALFGSAYKWLMAGHGTGFALFSPKLLKQLELKQEKLESIYDRGQRSVKAVGSFIFFPKQTVESRLSRINSIQKRIDLVAF